MFLGRTLTKSAPLIGKKFFSNTASPFQKLYVGNLTWTQTEDSLRTLFSKHGEINDLFLVRDRLTGKSRGFAFVEFAEESQAEAAKAALNGFQHDGRPLKVNDAEEKRPQSYGTESRY